MATYPLRSSISDTYPNPSNATARTGLGQLWDYATSIPHGQCRLIKSGANLVLQRYNGQWLRINDTTYSIPTAGVSLAATGLSAGTTYYIYAYMSGATMTLEASTTTHATDTNTGVEIKSGDATRTLVGMARPITGPAWQDTTAQRFVISWFNPRPIYLQAVLASNTGNVNTGSYGVISSSLNLEFLTWSTNAFAFKFQGRLGNNVANAVSTTSIFLDAAAAESFTSTQAYAASALQPVSCSLETSASEGYHAVNIYAQQDVVSTATYTGSGSPAVRCVHSGVIQG